MQGSRVLVRKVVGKALQAFASRSRRRLLYEARGCNGKRKTTVAASFQRIPPAAMRNRVSHRWCLARAKGRPEKVRTAAACVDFLLVVVGVSDQSRRNWEVSQVSRGDLPIAVRQQLPQSMDGCLDGPAALTNTQSHSSILQYCPVVWNVSCAESNVLEYQHNLAMPALRHFVAPRSLPTVGHPLCAH